MRRLDEALAQAITQVPQGEEILRRVIARIDANRSRPLAEQPAPIASAEMPVWELVIADVESRLLAEPIRDRLLEDMRERDALGRARYGVPLQAFNGRSMRTDGYEETLDQIVYLRGELAELEQLGRSPRELSEVEFDYHVALDLAWRIRRRIDATTQRMGESR